MHLNLVRDNKSQFGFFFVLFCDMITLGSDCVKIIYMHHAERNITENHNDPRLRQLEDITEIGIKEASLLAER